MNSNVFCNTCHRIPSQCGCGRGINSYELADRIEDNFYLNEAAKMLRQQSDLIKEASQFIQEQGLEGQWIIWSQKANKK
jgi:hypothetical protein